MTATTGRVWPLIRQRIDRFGIRDFSLPSLTGLTRYAYSRVHAPTRLPLYYNFSAPMIIQRISADLTIDSISRRFSPPNSQKITANYLSINWQLLYCIQRRLFDDYNSSPTFLDTLLRKQDILEFCWHSAAVAKVFERIWSETTIRVFNLLYL